jgi:hypothetical protein
MAGQSISRYPVDYSSNVNKYLVGYLAICNLFNTTRIVRSLAENYHLIDSNFNKVEEQYYLPTSVNNKDVDCIKRPIVYLHAREDPVVSIDSTTRTSDYPYVVINDINFLICLFNDNNHKVIS